MTGKSHLYLNILISVKEKNNQTRRRFGDRQPLCGRAVISRINVTRIPAS
jgi:hypothetical protein